MLQLAWSCPAPDLSLTRDGGDPLGLRAYANRLARELCPGLTQTTRRTRGFSLLTLGLQFASQTEDEDSTNDCFLRFERLFVVAQVHHFGDQAAFAGRRRAAPLLQSAIQTGTVDLRVPILTSQLSAGLWGTYRRAAHLFGLINAPGQGGPRAATLTTRGRDLAKALAASLLPHAHWNRHIQKGEVPLELVKRVDADKTGKAPRKDEVRIVSEGMKGFDRGHSQALRRLRQSFDLHGTLTLESLDPATLTERQRDARAAALGLRHLLSQIEAPYRAWVTGEDVDAALDASLWASEAWELARRRGEHEVLHLRDQVQRAPDDPMAAIHAHQVWLAGLRGAPPWQKGDGDPTKARFVMPDFGLYAPARLFAEGVDPR